MKYEQPNHSIKQKINQLLSKVTGYHLTKSTRNYVTDLLNTKWMKQFNINTIIDVGANTGQFAKFARAAMPKVKIVSFEPIPAVYNDLVNHFKHDPNFIAYNYALGENEETATLEQNEFTPASSLLPFTHQLQNFYSAAGTSSEIHVIVKRLDKSIDINSLESNILLKIDVQGFEDKVILGSQSVLDKIKIIYIECSYQEIYKGQPLFEDIYELLHKHGFLFRGIGDQLNGGLNNEPMQIDAIFINPKIN